MKSDLHLEATFLTDDAKACLVDGFGRREAADRETAGRPRWEGACRDQTPEPVSVPSSS